jgi:hypothetical protein
MIFASSINTPSPFLHMGILRRQLLAELTEIREAIASFPSQDEMTRCITEWQELFSTELQRSANESAVCDTYIALLQRLLRDPITYAPLDLYAVLGSDGHTYGQLSLAVYALSVPEAYRQRSPMHAQDPAHFFTIPHPLVRHLLSWLQSHDALLYDEELENTYLSLLPQQPSLSTEERMRRIMERQVAREAAVARREQEQRDALEAHLERQLQGWSEELRQRVAPVEESLDAAAEAAHTRLNRMEEEQQRDFANLRARVDATDTGGEQEQERLRRQVETCLREGLQPLAQRIDAHTERVTESVRAAAQGDTRSLRELEQEILSLRATAADLGQRNQQLGRDQQTVSEQIHEAQADQKELKDRVQNLQTAIDEIQDNSLKSLIKTVACVGGCVFATWAIGGVISVAPISNGVAVKATIFL